VSWTQRALRHFRSAVIALALAHAPLECVEAAERLAERLSERLGAPVQRAISGNLWSLIDRDCEDALTRVPYRFGSLSQAVEWETLKLQSRLQVDLDSPHPPLFRDGHIHIGALMQLWHRLALETEEVLAAQGIDTTLDVGPWGGFNFALQPDGYTRKKFARLTLGVASLPSLPLQDNGGPFFEAFLPRYRSELLAAGLSIPDEWGYHHPKRDARGRLLELSCIYYFPGHTYERRNFVKIRVSREFETVEEIALRDFLVLLERLHYTADWQLYRESTQNVDARFDIQDFISLSHLVEGVYHRTDTEEALLNEIKGAFFDGTIREPGVLDRYRNSILRARWIEHLYWAIAETALGVKKYQRPVMLGRELFPEIPPRLLIPVRRHLQAYHQEVGSRRPA